MCFNIINYILIVLFIISFLLFVNAIYRIRKDGVRKKDPIILLESKVKEKLEQEEEDLDFNNWNEEDLKLLFKIINQTKSIIYKHHDI